MCDLSNAYTTGIEPMDPRAQYLFIASMELLIISVHHRYELGRLEDRTRTLAEEVALLRLQVESDRPTDDSVNPA